MYAATGGPNMKWGVQILNGGRAPLRLPLATALLPHQKTKRETSDASKSHLNQAS